METPQWLTEIEEKYNKIQQSQEYQKTLKEKKYLFKLDTTPKTAYLPLCLTNYLAPIGKVKGGQGERSEHFRNMITEFFDIYFEAFLKITCKTTEIKVFGLSILKTHKYLITSLKEMGYFTSECEVIRFILIFNLLKKYTEEKDIEDNND